MNVLRQFIKLLPTLGLSFALALAVWITAVTSADPSIVQLYPPQVPIEITGQSSDLVLVDPTNQQATLTINAPQSEWTLLSNDPTLVTATADLSGLGPGEHIVNVDINLNIRAATVVSQSPETLTVTLENQASRTLPVTLVRGGEPAIGFQAEAATLSQDMATVTGPESLVNQVEEIRAIVDVGDAHESINLSVPLAAIDGTDNEIANVSIEPGRIQVEQPISQRGGFRSDLVVRPVYQGRLADGYRLTSISVFPPAVTVFSSDPGNVDDLPGYVETEPINLDGISDDIEARVALNLPEGISLVGDQRVLIQIGIAAIESSLTMPNQLVQIEGLAIGLDGNTTPEGVDLIVSGPLPLLNTLSAGDILVFIDVTGLGVGIHQVIPQVEVRNEQLRVESILPGTLEVEIFIAPTPTVGPSATP
jgi:YbbR domain-containing protein